MTKLYIFFASLFHLVITAQTVKTETETLKPAISPYVVEAQNFQKELNAEYLNRDTTPLRGDNFTNFKQHPFFNINLDLRVKAKLVRTKDAKPFEIPTSAGTSQPYIEYGKASFEIDGKTYVLSIYKNLTLEKIPEYHDYLFLPFRDKTNGNGTYGGGRYLDLKIPDSNTIILDFNKAYQPYCAYNAYDYQCPIVPEVNTLPIRIEAGVKYDDVYHH